MLGTLPDIVSFPAVIFYIPITVVRKNGAHH